MAGSLSPAFEFAASDANGAPYAGGKLYTYLAGTSTPASVFTDAALAIPHANPVILDARGTATIFLPDTGSFKFILQDVNSVVIKTVDNIVPVGLSAAQLNALANLRDGLYMWAGSDAGALMGTAYPTGLTKDARAPGTGLFVITSQVTVHFEATLWADAGATAKVALFPTSVPNTAVLGSELQSTNADGELVKTAAPVTLAAGTYFVKGHSTHASLQAFGLGYRIVPTT